MTRHIVIITPGFACDENDSTCIPLLQFFAKNLQKRGVRVTIIALQYPYTNQPYFWNEIPVHPMSGANKKWKKPFLFGKVKKAFQEIHRQHPVTTIHAFWLNEPMVIAQRLSEQFGIPVIASSQGQDVKPENRYLRTVRAKRIRVVALSAFQEDVLMQSGIKAFDVIRPEVEAPVYNPQKTIDIIGVGNLIPLKDFGYLVGLLSALKKKGTAFSAKIVGDGPERGRLEQLALKMGLRECLEFTGELSHMKTLEAIASAQVLVHPSHFEGFGLVMEEALVSGTHVMAQPVGAAFESEEIVHLCMRIEVDVEMLSALLQMPPKEAKSTLGCDMIQRYLEVYDRLGA